MVTLETEELSRETSGFGNIIVITIILFWAKRIIAFQPEEGVTLCVLVCLKLTFL